MKITFDKNEFIETLAPAMSCVSNKNTLSAIEGVMLSAGEGQRCRLTAYDLEKGYDTTFEAGIIEKGCVVINANKLAQIIRLMPSGTVMLEAEDKGNAVITGGRSRFELHTLSSRDFPALPDFSGEKGFSISEDTLRDMISRTIFAVAQNDSRVALNGTFFSVEKGVFLTVACDGNRIALRREKNAVDATLNSDSQTDFHFIVPGKSVIELVKMLDDGGERGINIYLGRKHVMFSLSEGTMFFSRLIDSEYIEYERFFIQDAKTKVTLDRDSFIHSLECASLVTEERSLGQVRSCVKCFFTSEDGGLARISSISVTGKVEDEFPAKVEGDDIEIGFNCRFILDAMRSCGVQSVVASLQSPLMSMILEPADGEENGDFLFMVLPVRM